jgi:prepilin-type N-terminal cleavage/methylation domain-containing protein
MKTSATKKNSQKTPNMEASGGDSYIRKNSYFEAPVFRSAAFTLVELIIVITVIAVLAAAIFVAIDPIRRINESNNARRWSDVTTVMEGIIKYVADNGSHYSTVSGTTAALYYQIGTAGSGCDTGCGAQTTQAACVDLTSIGSTYLGAVPLDPSTGTAAETDYYISRASNNSITIGACDPQAEGAGGGGSAPTITLTR